MSVKDNPLRKEKRRKLEELLKKGIDPYPHSYKKTHYASQLDVKYKDLKIGSSSEEEVSLAGRMMRKRNMGKSSFFNLQDQTGEFQCYIKEQETPQAWGLWKLTDIGDIIGVKGVLFKTQKGELSLRVKELKMLCKSLEPLPEKYHGLEDAELKYRFRHLDLIMNPNSRKVFLTRSQIISSLREYMNKEGFVEMEIPTLQALYGGAAAVPFKTHHRRLDRELFLKISPELYLKKLIVGGFEKVYEIGKNFRNEGIDRTHNPEFTMMEYYEAYTDYQDQMERFEKLVCYVVQKIKGSLKINYQGKEIDFESPWERISVEESIKKYGSISIKESSIKELIDKLKVISPKENYDKFKSLKDKSSLLWDELIILTFDLTVEKKLWNPTFITDFPKGVSPLTKTHRQNKHLVERFEPFCANMEIGNAYTELNNPLEQIERFSAQTRYAESEENPPMDDNFIHALEVGLPPTGGVGLGVERFVMILTDQLSIKDVILFPVLKDKKE